MKDTRPYIVNCARGGIIDEAALYSVEERQAGRRGSRRLWSRNRLKESPLRELDNVADTAFGREHRRSASRSRALDVARQIVDVLVDVHPCRRCQLRYLCRAGNPRKVHWAVSLLMEKLGVKCGGTPG